MIEPLILTAISLALAMLSAAIALRAHREVRRLGLQLDALMGVKGGRAVKKLRKRYVVFAVIAEKCPERAALEEAVRAKLSELFGKSAEHKASPYLVFYDGAACLGVIRVSHIYKARLIAALSMVKEAGGAKCLVIPLRTTGTLKSAKKYMERYSAKRK